MAQVLVSLPPTPKTLMALLDHGSDLTQPCYHLESEPADGKILITLNPLHPMPNSWKKLLKKNFIEIYYWFWKGWCHTSALKILLFHLKGREGERERNGDFPSAGWVPKDLQLPTWVLRLGQVSKEPQIPSGPHMQVVRTQPLELSSTAAYLGAFLHFRSL